MKKVLVMDTSVLCVWLDVPGMSHCGSDDDKWDKPRVDATIRQEHAAKTTFVLPLASIIETGNHISQAAHSRRERAIGLANLMRDSANQHTPWAAFSDQSQLWATEKVLQLAESWPDLASQKLSLGDATIKGVAEYYAQMGWQVEILTGDNGLKAYQPVQPLLSPRRRQRQ